MVIGSGSQKSYKGQRGVAEVRVDADAGQVRADCFDAVIIPGGEGRKVTSWPSIALPIE
jgi:putative intracellular protease/amidase